MFLLRRLVCPRPDKLIQIPGLDPPLFNLGGPDLLLADELSYSVFSKP